MDELNKLLNELKTLYKANCNKIESGKLMFVIYLKDEGYKYYNMSMIIDDLYAASMMGERKIEIAFPHPYRMMISDDVKAFANGRRKKYTHFKQSTRETWGIFQLGIQDT